MVSPNTPAPGVPYYTPAQDPPAGTALAPESAPTLFQPLRMRSVELHNRFVVSPMCQYSAADGHLTDYHLVHLGQFALAGAGLVIVEASAVEPRGRITPEDSGIWTDSQIAPLRRITDFIHSQGTKAGIQLAHAGRKASTLAPWIVETRGSKALANEDANGWPDNVVGPSAISHGDGYAQTKALTVDEIQDIVKGFADAAVRAVAAGFDVIEIHGAHGYLMLEFLSPLSNKRTDQYGGSFKNRIRFLIEVVQAVRAVIPAEMPLWLRISATEWMEWAGEPSWDLESTITLAKLLPGLGIDLLDVSSGGNNSAQKIKTHLTHQTDLAAKIRNAVHADGLNLLIGAVGFISEAEFARSLVQQDKPTNGTAVNGDKAADTIEVNGEHGQVLSADVILAARQFLREPNWVLKVADELNVPVKWPNQYHRAPRPRKNKA